MSKDEEKGKRPEAEGEAEMRESSVSGAREGKVHKERKTGHRMMPPKARDVSSRERGDGLKIRDILGILKEWFLAMREKVSGSKISRYGIGKKAAMISFAALTLASVALCTFIGYSYSGDSIREVSRKNEAARSNSKAYRIVYSTSDAFGLSAAESLQSQFLAKTGTSLEIVPDSEPIGKHEIRIGHTNRSGDDYITGASTLGMDGYAVVISAGDNIDLLAFSSAGAEAAVKFFVRSYVGAYRPGEIVFATKMNFSFVSKTGEEPVSSLRKSKITLDFSESGEFKILVLSDPDINPNTISAIENMLDAKKPDLVIFAGDLSSGIGTRADFSSYLSVLSAPLEERKIPWTAVFGEQDTSGGLSAAVLTEVCAEFEHCVIKNEISEDGAVSHFLPIYENGGGGTDTVPVFGIWAMGQRSSLRESGAANESILSGHRENGTDYGYVPASHIAFFTENTRVLARECGKNIPSVMVTHTPVPEFSIIVQHPIPSGLVGNVGEQVAASPINSGLFASLVDAGSVKGLYVGHDHLNSFSGKYCGIELGYSSSIGFDGYGLGGTFEINNQLRGGRMINLTLKNGEVITTSQMVYASSVAPKTEE